MHEPNQIKVDIWKGERGYKKDFVKFLKKENPCQYEQAHWIDVKIPNTEAGRDFILDYMALEIEACKESGGEYAQYAEARHFPKHDIFYANNWAKVGDRVKRGPTWVWADQDYCDGNPGKPGPGTVIGTVDRAGWVRVRWDSGRENSYRVLDYEDIIPLEE